MAICHKHTKPWQEVDKEDCPYCKLEWLEAELSKARQLGLKWQAEAEDLAEELEKANIRIAELEGAIEEALRLLEGK